MRRFKSACLLVTLLAAAACSDESVVSTTATRRASALRSDIGLGDKVAQLIVALYPTGLETSAGTRWDNVRGKLAVGDSSTAIKMYFQLVAWVDQKIPQMDAPANGMTRQQAATQLVLWMSRYVFAGGDTASLPTLGPDVGFTIVNPGTATTLTAPTKKAGVFIPATAAPVPFTLIVYQSATHYAPNCSGPLTTALCQYPQFYKFEPYPHVVLNTPAAFAVCHVNAGPFRTPLPGSDHDNYRLAHTLSPAGPFASGGQVRNGPGEFIEVLPLTTVSFMDCHEGDDVYSLLDGPLHRAGQELYRLANALGRALSPTPAYAIDQGGGGFSFTFSDFNVVDPNGTPDLSVSSTSTDTRNGTAGNVLDLAVTVQNVGTSTALLDSIQVSIGAPANAEFPPPPIVFSIPVASIVPLDTPIPVSVTLPANMGSGSYTATVQAFTHNTIPESNLANNSVSVPVFVGTIIP